MPELKNIRHERFCLLYLICGNASEAYRQAGYPSKTPDVNACQLLVKPKIKARIAELMPQNRVKSRDDVLQWLSEMMSRPVDEPMKWSDKLRAGEIYVRMCGYNAPEEVQLSAANSLTTYLLQLRERAINAEVTEIASDSATPLQSHD